MQVTSRTLGTQFKKLWLQTLLLIVGRTLRKAARVDPEIKKEIDNLAEGFSFSLKIMGLKHDLRLEKKNGRLVPTIKENTSLTITFKHLSHAFEVLSFQQSIVGSFVQDRMIIDGDVPSSMKLVRALERLEALILPAIISRRLMKDYPNIGFMPKCASASRIYLGLITG